MSARIWMTRAIAAITMMSILPTATLAGGTLKASAKLEGERCRRTVVKMDADAYCAKSHDKKVGSETCIVSKSGNIKNVIVYVKEGLGDKKFDPPTEPAQIDQSGCMYKPHVLTVQAGQPVIIRNSDATLHNIHSFAKKQRAFNFAQPQEGMTKEVKFTRPEFVKVKCDVHPWMSAFVGVFTHPHHTVTSKKGVCELADLPPGEYTIGAWHEEYGELEQKVTITEGETKELAFSFKAK